MRCGIALGSNLGDRLDHLRSGMALLKQAPFPLRITAVAPVFETAPVDCGEEAGAFYNTVVEIDCETDPHRLRECTAEIERSLGRPDRRPVNAPRTLDLDLLYFGDCVMEDAVLILPHPRMTERRFVLEPLACIRPDLVLPGQTDPVSTLLGALPEEEGFRQVWDKTWLESSPNPG